MAELVKKTTDYNKELINWFEVTYPGTSFTWVANKLLESFKLAHEENPIDYFAIGAQYLKKEIDDNERADK